MKLNHNLNTILYSIFYLKVLNALSCAVNTKPLIRRSIAFALTAQICICSHSLIIHEDWKYLFIKNRDIHLRCQLLNWSIFWDNICFSLPITAYGSDRKRMCQIFINTEISGSELMNWDYTPDSNKFSAPSIDLSLQSDRKSDKITAFCTSQIH